MTDEVWLLALHGRGTLVIWYGYWETEEEAITYVDEHATTDDEPGDELRACHRDWFEAESKSLGEVEELDNVRVQNELEVVLGE